MLWNILTISCPDPKPSYFCSLLAPSFTLGNTGKTQQQPQVSEIPKSKEKWILALQSHRNNLTFFSLPFLVPTNTTL